MTWQFRQATSRLPLVIVKSKWVDALQKRMGFTVAFLWPFSPFFARAKCQSRVNPTSAEMTSPTAVPSPARWLTVRSEREPSDSRSTSNLGSELEHVSWIGVVAVGRVRGGHLMSASWL